MYNKRLGEKWVFDFNSKLIFFIILFLISVTVIAVTQFDCVTLIQSCNNTFLVTPPGLKLFSRVPRSYFSDSPFLPVNSL